MSVGSEVEKLAKMYTPVINKGVDLKILPSVMLWGPPGVGKSQGVRELADILGENTGRKTEVTDVGLLLFNPVDLRGIPTSNADKTLAVWLKPKIFQMDERDDIINILFLDEISAAPPSVQTAAYSLKDIAEGVPVMWVINNNNVTSPWGRVVGLKAIIRNIQNTKEGQDVNTFLSFFFVCNILLY